MKEAKNWVPVTPELLRHGPVLCRFRFKEGADWITGGEVTGYSWIKSLRYQIRIGGRIDYAEECEVNASDLHS